MDRNAVADLLTYGFCGLSPPLSLKVRKPRPHQLGKQQPWSNALWRFYWCELSIIVNTISISHVALISISILITVVRQL